MKESYSDRKKLLDELQSAKELQDKTTTNLLLLISFTILGLGMIIISFENTKSHNSMEIIYYVTTAAFCIYNAYVAMRILKEHPFPKDPVFQNLVNFQINHIKDFNHKLQPYFFLGITPVYIGLLGVLSMEFKIGDVLEIGQVVWIKFSLVQILYAICLGRALYLRFYFKKLAKRFFLNV